MKNNQQINQQINKLVQQNIHQQLYDFATYIDHGHDYRNKNLLKFKKHK